MKIFLIALSLLPVGAFRASLVPAARPAFLTKVRAFPERFERAVQCGSNFELCNVDELNDLVNELESYQGSFFESDEELRAKEIQDREDLADVLRLEAELKHRQEYLKNANLFKEDVEEAVMLKHRDEYLELMDEYADI